MKKTLIILFFVASFVLSSCQSNSNNVEVSMNVFSDGENSKLSSPKISNYDVMSFEDDENQRLIFEEVDLTNLVDSEGLFSLIGVKKEFKFPYYYYTFSLDNFENIDDLKRSITLKVFGEIIETNGDFNDLENSVKFDLTKSKEYYVTFKDFFILSILRGTHNLKSRKSKSNTPSLSFEKRVETFDSGLSNEENNMKLLPLSLSAKKGSNEKLDGFYFNTRIAPGSKNINLNDLIIEIIKDGDLVKIRDYEIVDRCDFDEVGFDKFQVVYLRDSNNRGFITRSDILKICFSPEFEYSANDEIDFYFYVEGNEKVNLNLFLPEEIGKENLNLYP
ncbi:MAG: hypothetical protein ACOCRX_07085 [Candidatus Woesearchaeota archaeon]